MPSKQLVAISATDDRFFWDVLPREWSLRVNSVVQVYTVDVFLQKLLDLLQDPAYSSFRKRHKSGNNDSHPVHYTDRDMFHEFWIRIGSHGSVKQVVCRDVAKSKYGTSKWYMLLLPVQDDSIIYRVVHSLQKQWPGCSACMSVSLVLQTFDKERAIVFSFTMQEPVWTQQVLAMLEMGVIACTMLPRRVALSLEWFSKQHDPTSDKPSKQVVLHEACSGHQQEVIAVVARMTSYLEFHVQVDAIAVPAAQSCLYFPLELLAS